MWTAAAYTAHQLERAAEFRHRGLRQIGAGDADRRRWSCTGRSCATPATGARRSSSRSRRSLAAPQSATATSTRSFPNEDSLDLEFTDANLFALNRFTGVDRLEGGMRANVALHGAWMFPAGGSVDALIGQGYRLKKDWRFPQISGLRDTASDIVSHLSCTPNQYFDVTSRQRFDTHDARSTSPTPSPRRGRRLLRFSAGYIYTTHQSVHGVHDRRPAGGRRTTPRNEISLGANTNWRTGICTHRRGGTCGEQDGLDAGGRQLRGRMLHLRCEFYRRYTSLNNDNGSTRGAVSGHAEDGGRVRLPRVLEHDRRKRESFSPYKELN